MKPTTFLKLFVPQSGKTLEGRYGAFLNDIVLSERSSGLIVGHVPRVVNTLLLVLNSRCLKSSEIGVLFEKPVNQFKKNKLKKILNSGRVDIDFSPYSINTVFEAIMDFFMELKRPLLSPRRSHIRKLYSISQETDPVKHRKQLTVYLSDLPTSHYQTAKKLFIFLCQLTKYKTKVERTGEKFVFELSHRFAKCCMGKFCTLKRLRPLRKSITLIIMNAHLIFDHPEVHSVKVFELSSESDVEDVYKSKSRRKRMRRILSEEEEDGEEEEEEVIVAENNKRGDDDDDDGDDEEEEEGEEEDDDDDEEEVSNDLTEDGEAEEIEVEVKKTKTMSTKRFVPSSDQDSDQSSVRSHVITSTIQNPSFTKDQILLEIGREYFNKEEFEVRLKLETERLKNRLKEEMETQFDEKLKSMEKSIDEKYGFVITKQKEEIKKLQNEMDSWKRDTLTTNRKYLMTTNKIDGLDTRMDDVEKWVRNNSGKRDLSSQQMKLEMDHLKSRVQDHQSRFKKLNFEMTQLRLQMGTSDSLIRISPSSRKMKKKKKIKKRKRLDGKSPSSPSKLFKKMHHVRKMIREDSSSDGGYVPGMYDYTPISKRRGKRSSEDSSSSSYSNTSSPPVNDLKRDHGKSFLEYNSVRLNLLRNEIEDIINN